MNLDKRFDGVLSTMIGTASVVAGVVIAGTALNSQLAMRLENVPIIGFPIRPLRAVINQVFDSATVED